MVKSLNNDYLVIGNSGCPEERCVTVSFTCQVRTKVSGKVNEGDYVLADSSSAGYAKSKGDVGFEEFKKKVVGVALEDKNNEGVARILETV